MTAHHDPKSFSAHPLPSSEFLHSVLRYDDVHGHLYWRPRPKTHHPVFNARFAMRRADNEMQSGYARVRMLIGGKYRTFQAHRIIWKMVYGFDPYPEIDHIDRDPTNNRHFNLRIVTRLQNSHNRSLTRRSGRGVYPTKGGRFRAQVKVNGKVIHLGTFDTAELARAAVFAVSPSTH